MPFSTCTFHLWSQRNSSHFASYRYAIRQCATLALVALCFLIATEAAHGAEATVELRALVTNSNDTTQQITSALVRRYVRVTVSSDPTALAARHRTGILLTIGPAALEAALSARVADPVVALFTSKQEFERITRMTSRGEVTAIYAEASPASQLKLISRLYGRPVSVAVLETPGTSSLLASLRAALPATGLTLSPIPVTEHDNILRALARAAPFDVLLVQPDRTLYVQEGIRGILESTYRRRQGVIGFSTALVQAGMLGATFASLDDTFDQLDELIDSISRTGHIPAPQYPLYWRTAINENVARSLGLVVDDEVRLLGNRPQGRGQ